MFVYTLMKSTTKRVNFLNDEMNFQYNNRQRVMTEKRVVSRVKSYKRSIYSTFIYIELSYKKKRTEKMIYLF